MFPGKDPAHIFSCPLILFAASGVECAGGSLTFQELYAGEIQMEPSVAPHALSADDDLYGLAGASAGRINITDSGSGEYRSQSQKRSDQKVFAELLHGMRSLSPN